MTQPEEEIVVRSSLLETDGLPQDNRSRVRSGDGEEDSSSISRSDDDQMLATTTRRTIRPLEVEPSNHQSGWIVCGIDFATCFLDREILATVLILIVYIVHAAMVSARKHKPDGEWVPVGDAIKEDVFPMTFAMASNGSVLAVGSSWNNGSCYHQDTYSKRVRVYDLTTGGGRQQWVQRGSDIIKGVCTPYSRFGESMSISDDGSVLVVGNGVYGMASNDALGRVYAHVWDSSSSAWALMGSPIDGKGRYDYFGGRPGLYLSGDGSMIAAGSSSSSERIRLLEWKNNKWSESVRSSALDGKLVTSSGFAFSMSSDGNVIAFGASDSFSYNTNFARVIRWAGTSWIQMGADFRGQTINDRFGSSVSLSADGMVVAFGARHGNYCRVFEYDGSDWVERGKMLKGGPSVTSFGYKVTLSRNGDTVMVGGSSTDVDFEGLDKSGIAWVFRFTPERGWIQLGHALHDRGSSVMSNDGLRVAIGQHANRTSSIRVFEFNDNEAAT